MYIIASFHKTTIFASQGLQSALLIFTLGIVRQIFEVTRWQLICNAASGSGNQSERTLQRANKDIFSDYNSRYRFALIVC